MDSLSSYEFALLRHDLHAFVAQKEVDERLPSIRANRLARQHNIASLAQHSVRTHIIQRGSLDVRIDS